MSKPTCPVCDRPASAAERPFCSRGCRDRDLLRWLDEGYRLPGRAPLDEGDSDGVDKPPSAD